MNDAHGTLPPIANALEGQMNYLRAHIAHGRDTIPAGPLHAQVAHMQAVLRDVAEVERDLITARNALTLLKPPDHFHVVAQQVMLERKDQDAKWGGPAHDDRHSLVDWIGLIRDQSYPVANDPRDEIARPRLIKMAALAIAAVQAIDRRGGGLAGGATQ